MWKVGLSTGGIGFSEALLSQCRDAGVTEMEISEAGYGRFDFAAARRLSEQYGVHLWSLHLPFVPFETIDVSSPDKAVRQNTVQVLSEIIRRSGDIGIDKCVVHPSAEVRQECNRDERIACGQETLAALAAVGGECGVTVCVENLPRLNIGRDSSEVERLMQADSRLKACLDTNHFLTEDVVCAIRRLGDRIVTLHVSDCDRVNERHWLPGEGNLDWHAIVQALCEVGYGGLWMYEIAFRCPPTILRDRPLCPADFVRNADEVLNGRPITVFSSPKPNLGMWE